MTLTHHKTKLVCTIGPASESPVTLRQLLEAGMTIARLNFSHGDFAWHKLVIERLRRVAHEAGRSVTIMADLPGPKMRIGQLAEEPIEHDHDCLKFALENGVDAIGQSFVETAADVDAVRQAAAALGFHPFIIAKIERADALLNIEGILKAADGIMIARGDLGVETPIERMAVLQKQLIAKANALGKPVITATQMLESMVSRSRPTRAESTDVANAILDGTDCVMLSEESAMGKFPIQAVRMLAKIAAATEPHLHADSIRTGFANYDLTSDLHLVNLISRNVQHTVAHLAPIAVIVPTTTGYTARTALYP